MHQELNHAGNRACYWKVSIVFSLSFSRTGRNSIWTVSCSLWIYKWKQFPISCKLWFTKERWKSKALLIHHEKQRVISLPLLCFHIIMLTACTGGITEFLNKNNTFLHSTFIIHISSHPAGQWCLLPVTLNLFHPPLICLAQLHVPLITVPVG